VPQSPPPGSEAELERSTDEDISGDLLQVSDTANQSFHPD
jgi:hypothetical protein